jgi:GT2 family glycosyltransferase
VSIIIPTRDHLELLRPCVEGLLQNTRYNNFEIIIVDNGSIEPATIGYLRDLAGDPLITVMRDDRAYNYSRLNNAAATVAKGEYLCLLNNDTEVIEPGWLEAMMRYATRPDVGAVGARLLYDDHSVQHAGVVVGMGQAAGHAHRFLTKDEPGYFARTYASHVVTAVTAACLLVSRQKYEAVGGLDEQNLAIAFNDVDFCLKLQSQGWKNIYTPYARLIHHESKSRGKDVSRQHIDRYRRELATLQERWGTPDYRDPLHHIHLDRSSERYLIGL